MKKYIALIVLFTTFRSLLAQDPNCTKENVPISTDWRRYIPNNPDFPNNWDWTTQPNTGYPVYLTNNQINPSFYIDLPYRCRNVQGQGSCGQINALHYEILETEGKKQDIYPEDGWELLLKNFGTPTIGTQIGVSVDNPFFVLYNKINGKMRVFYAIVGKKTGSSMVLRIAFDDESRTRRAVFAHVQPIAQTLQEFGRSNQYQILNQYAQGSTETSYYWLVGDIITSYDPCTCNFSDGGSAQVTVTPVLVKVSSIIAEIEGTLTQRVASNGQVQGSTDGQLSFKEIGDIGEKAVAKGQKSYNEFEKHRKSLVDFISKRDTEFVKRLTEWTAREKEALFTKDAVADQLGLKPVNEYGRLFNGLKTIAPAIPYVGAAWGLIEFWMSGGANKPSPAPPTPPVVTDVGLKLVGQISERIDQTPFSFNLPGSTPTSNTGLSPLYNRTLGVFNILKPPAMEYFELKVNDVSVTNRSSSSPTNACIDNLDEFGEGYFMASNQAPRQFRLKEDVKYLVNPMANLEVDMIDACFVVEYANTEKLFMESPTKFPQTPALPLYNLVSKQDNVISPTETSWEKRARWIEESGWDLEYVSEGYPKKEGSFIRFRTKYMPLQCLKNLNFILWGGETPKIYLKMAIKAKRTDVQNAEDVMQIVMYNVAKSYKEATLNSTLRGNVSLALAANQITNHTTIFRCGMGSAPYRKFDNFNYDTHLGGTDFIIGNLPIPNPYYKYPNVATISSTISVFGVNFPAPPFTSNITVQNDIIIEDNVTIANGVILKSGRKIVVGKNVTFGKDVELVAGYSIDVAKETQIDMNNVTLRIDRASFNPLALFNCSDNNIKKLKATAAEIYGKTGICTNKIYKDSVLFKPMVAPNIGKKKAEDAKFIANVTTFPNPFSSFLKITYNLNDEDNISISLVNGLGQVVKEVLLEQNVREGNHSMNISTEDLLPGVYFIVMRSTKGGVQTQKVVKTN
ncbi:MAG: hypothetical protein RL757_914 [Bacteroidota bacterium]|jgi:hypothetical protein